MRTTKLTIKLFLIVSLFASTALADGQMGGGGFADDGQMGGGGFACNVEKGEICNEDDGQMGGGGVTDDGQMGGGGFADPVLIFVKDYLMKLFG